MIGRKSREINISNTGAPVIFSYRYNIHMNIKDSYLLIIINIITE